MLAEAGRGSVLGVESRSRVSQSAVLVSGLLTAVIVWVAYPGEPTPVFAGASAGLVGSYVIQRLLIYLGTPRAPKVKAPPPYNGWDIAVACFLGGWTVFVILAMLGVLIATE